MAAMWRSVLGHADVRHAADGEVAGSWPPDAEVRATCVMRALSPRWQSSRSPGSLRIIRKAVAQGGPGHPADLWFCRVLICCTRTAGLSRGLALPAPSVLRGCPNDQSSDAKCAARTRSYSRVRCLTITSEERLSIDACGHPSRRPPAAGSSG